MVRKLSVWSLDISSGGEIPNSPLYGMAVVQTESEAIVTGGFESVFWDAQQEKANKNKSKSSNPWVKGYNLGRAQTNVHQLKCSKSVDGCHWTKLNWNLNSARAYHAAFLIEIQQ